MSAPTYGSETRSYRGGSLEELLPRIVEELGEDAVIVRQREGIVGGFGGFFGKRLVEVEACGSRAAGEAPPGEGVTGDPPAGEHLGGAYGRRVALDAYDTGDPRDDLLDALQGSPLQTVAEQARPFADHLYDELDALPDPPPWPDHDTAAPAGSDDGEGGETPADVEVEMTFETPVEPTADADPAWRPFEPPRVSAEHTAAAEAAAPARPGARAESGPESELDTVRAELLAAGLEEHVVTDVVCAALRDFAPFDAWGSVRDQAREALAQRLSVRHGWRTEQRTLALVGAPGAGRTTAVAKLCSAYVHSGLTVGVIALEPPRNAFSLLGLTDHLGVDVRLAESPADARAASARLKACELVLVDTPPASTEKAELAALAALVRATGADETHLVVPGGADAADTYTLASALRGVLPIDRALVTHAEERAGAAVAAALAMSRPFSYLGRGKDPDAGIAPASPDALAKLVLP